MPDWPNQRQIDQISELTKSATRLTKSATRLTKSATDWPNQRIDQISDRLTKSATDWPNQRRDWPNQRQIDQISDEIDQISEKLRAWAHYQNLIFWRATPPPIFFFFFFFFTGNNTCKKICHVLMPRSCRIKCKGKHHASFNLVCLKQLLLNTLPVMLERCIIAEIAQKKKVQQSVKFKGEMFNSPLHLIYYINLKKKIFIFFSVFSDFRWSFRLFWAIVRLSTPIFQSPDGP